MRTRLSPIFGNYFSFYLSANSKQVIYAEQLPETSQTITSCHTGINRRCGALQASAPYMSW